MHSKRACAHCRVVEVAAVRATARTCTHDMGTARATCFLGPRSRHQFLCHDMAGLGQASSKSRHDFSCRYRGNCWGVATQPLASRLESSTVG